MDITLDGIALIANYKSAKSVRIHKYPFLDRA